MSLEDICNEDMEIGFTLTPGPPDAAYTGDVGIGAPEVVTIPAPSCKATAKVVQATSATITWTAAGCPFTSATYTFVSGAGLIAATATKVKCNGMFPLRKGDTGKCVGSWTLTASPFTGMVCNCTAEITDAGQAKDKGQ